MIQMTIFIKAGTIQKCLCVRPVLDHITLEIFKYNLKLDLYTIYNT